MKHCEELTERKTTHNSTYPKGGVSYSKDSLVVNQTLVFQIKFCGKSPALRVVAKRDGSHNINFMKRKFFYWVIVFFILWGCSKNSSTSITVFKGQVIDYDNNGPESNALIVVNRFNAISLINPKNYFELSQEFLETDNNGNYSLEIENNEKIFYDVTTSEIGYVEKNFQPEVLAKSINLLNEDTIYIGKTGYLILELENTPDGFDSLMLKFNTERYNFFPFVNDTIILEQFLYKDFNQIHLFWEIIDKPNNNEFSSDLQLIPLDTISIHITF